MYRPFAARSGPLACRPIDLRPVTRQAASMTWWSWDKEARCWRSSLVHANAPFGVNGHARLIPLNGTRRWALLARDGVRVNGRPCLPIQILGDRDEIAIDEEHFCLSLQSPPAVVEFRANTKNIRCARCLGRLKDGDEIVRCPGCGAHHHGACWTYDARCQQCTFRTDGSAWVPDPVT